MRKYGVQICASYFFLYLCISCNKEKGMLTKEEYLESIDFENLPEETTIENILEHAVLLEQIQLGLDDVRFGNVYTQEEIKQKVEEWFK